MDTDLPLLIDRSHPHCTVLTLNRPAKRNALTIELMKALCSAIKETESLPGQRALILKGSGTVFCSGLDLSEAADGTLEERSSLAIGIMLRTLYECPLVTIAAIQGAALAGGAGLICACDLAIAESGTFFGFPETRRGLIAAQIMPFVLRLLPRRLLNELILLGETVEAQRAYEIGLINRVVKLHGAFPEALKFVQSLTQGAPQTTAGAKKLIQLLEPIDLQEGLKIGYKLHREMRQGDEAKEGLQAFLEKRPPRWG